MSLYYSSRRRLSVACVEGEIILHKTYTLAEIVPKCVDHDDKPLWFRDHCKKTFTSPVVCKHFARNCWRNNVLKGDGCYYNGSRLSRDHTVYTTTPCQKVECDGNGTLFLYTTFHLLPTELTPTVQNFARMARQMQYKQYLSTASLLLGLIVFRIGVVSPSQRSPQNGCLYDNQWFKRGENHSSAEPCQMVQCDQNGTLTIHTCLQPAGRGCGNPGNPNEPFPECCSFCTTD
ncbi:uncharacterized protein LOC142590279 isoform X4 [Dermacentor variabilis]|uniref:uncharacterized protein LOC142590279 isoform X4 n=1 Tax=Dermacentor variabilis TaxID=34621 RepID=UPI003F5B857A